MELATLENTELITSPDWEKQPLRKDELGEVFSADDVIDAYFKGRIDQVSQDKQLQLNQLKENLKKAISLSEQLFKFINDKGFKGYQVFLKIKSIYSFTAFFLVDEDDYCSDAFMEVYEQTIAIKKSENTSKMFDFTTILTPNNDFFDKDSLRSDGYILSYAGGVH